MKWLWRLMPNKLIRKRVINKAANNDPVIKSNMLDLVKPKLVSSFSSDNNVDIKEALDVRGSIIIKGRGNRIYFGSGMKFNGDLTIQGDNNEVTLGRESVVRGRLLIKGKEQRVSVGDKTTFGSVYLLCQERCNVDIGSWCMFSRDVEIRTTDAHSVVDLKSRRRLNKPASIIVGDHVWVGVGALLSKGTAIASDSIVGAYTFVNDSFDETNIIVAGTPGKVVKQGITWNRGRKSKFTEEELNHWRSPVDENPEQ